MDTYKVKNRGWIIENISRTIEQIALGAVRQKFSALTKNVTKQWNLDVSICITVLLEFLL